MAVRTQTQVDIIDISDAYSVVLTSEAFTFVGGTGGVAKGATCSTEAVMFQGGTQLTAVSIDAASITFSDASGATATGVSAAVTNNNSSKPKITFTTTATVSGAIEATIPIVGDGVTIVKRFSMAVAKTGATGGTGVGVKATKPQYYLSTSNTSQAGGSWSDSVPTYVDGRYYWSRFVTTYTNNTTSTSTAVLDQGLTDANKKAYDANTAASAAQTKANQSAENLAKLTTQVNSDISDLQSQIDGAIENWFYDGVPTLENEPAKNWTDDKTKNVHLGDIYYDNKTGYAYRFKSTTDSSTGAVTYSWSRITDTDVTKALADAKKAQDTADGKRRVFYATPNPPYDAGDLWVQGSGGDIMRCQTAKESGAAYASADWVKASKYTDNSYAATMTKTVQTQYYLSTSTTSLAGGQWQDTAPTWVNGKYMWQRVKTTTGGGTITYTPSENGTCVAGAKGDTGAKGSDAIAMTITASGGTVFRNNTGSTTLTAHVYVGGKEQSITSAGVCGSYGTVKWYKAGSTTVYATANAITISATDVDNSVSFVAQLEQ